MNFFLVVWKLFDSELIIVPLRIFNLINEPLNTPRIYCLLT